MKQIFVAATLLLLSSFDSSAQKIISDHSFFNELLKDSIGILDIFSGAYDQPSNITLPDVPYKVQSEIIKTFIRDRQGLYMTLDGTGRIYEVKKEESDLALIRLDSTIFFGYNFAAYTFTFNDTIFSFGGYGFWTTNGHLRYFKRDNSEWERIPLAREITAKKSMAELDCNLWFDAYGKKLYALKSISHPDSVYALDMATKQWTTLGERLQTGNLKYFISTPWGLLCKAESDEDRYILLDFHNNIISTLNKTQSTLLDATLFIGYKAYMKDSTLFVTKKYTADALTKIELTRKDFIPTGSLIYEPLPIPNEFSYLLSSLKNNWIALVSVCISFFAGIALTYSILQRNNYYSRNKNGQPILKVFEQKETDLIKLILDKSSSDMTVTIEEINKVLGIADKHPDIQKKHRSDIITTINNKYRLSTGQPDNLLSSIRSNTDKRSFEYFIDPAKIESIKKLF